MFTFTYLKGDFRRRQRQVAVMSLGLAVGVALALTVMAMSSGVRNAQRSALQSLYGVGTDVTVTQAPEAGETNLAAFDPVVEALESGDLSPGAAATPFDGLIGYGDGDTMGGIGLGRLDASLVGEISRLPGVRTAVGGLTATDLQGAVSVPSPSCEEGANQMAGGLCVRLAAFQVSGVDTASADLGPLNGGTISAGRSFTRDDAEDAVAVVDAGYARQESLDVGSAVTVAGTTLRVIGVVTPAAGTSPAAVYIPLTRAQALTGMSDEVNTIYVAASGASEVQSVREAIVALAPSATVTSSANLAAAVSGTLGTVTRLTDDVGRWVAIIVVAAAVSLACLLTLSAVAARAGELGLLKALGWGSRRVVAQVTLEALAQGAMGAVIGVALGAATAAVVSLAAPSLSASVGLPGSTSADPSGAIQGGAFQDAIGSSLRVGELKLSAPLTPTMLALAVSLALAGGLLAGAIGSWRAARLRPAVALAQVE
jgi:ABC-type lipoprotein release transport system permease subunit